jgi:pyrimidine operon attenuation protein/uracil phosphoribosyltransferase
MTDTPDDRTLRLLDLVGRHCRTIAAAIDELTKIGAKRELHLISVRNRRASTTRRTLATKRRSCERR